MLTLNEREKAYLLTVARGSIINKFIEDRDPDSFEHPTFETDSDALTTKRPIFVSLYSYNMLRGCRGHYKPFNPVLTEVYDQARFAAFEDERFAPLTQSELAAAEIIISVLSKPLHTDPYAVQLGQHGVMIKQGTTTAALLLPHVGIREGFTIEQFWSNCCTIAGLPSDAWQSRRLSLLKFTAEEFGDHDIEMQRAIQALYREEEAEKAFAAEEEN